MVSKGHGSMRQGRKQRPAVRQGAGQTSAVSRGRGKAQQQGSKAAPPPFPAAPKHPHHRQATILPSPTSCLLRAHLILSLSPPHRQGAVL
jgi:hypothetical protein